MLRALFPVLAVLSSILTVFSLTFVVPIIFAWWAQEPTLSSFIWGFAITFLSGVGGYVLTRPFHRELKIRDGFLLISLVWSVLPAFTTIPLLIYMGELSFTDAYFEMVSSLTTTGATVFSNLDGLPGSINLWRCFLPWIGGLGIVIFAVSVLPLLGVGGSQVFKAETTGPIKDNKLAPRITETARLLYSTYLIVSIACLFSYKSAGMSWFDAFLHTGTTVSLSGFSSHDASFGYWNSPAIEMVAVTFMLLAAINFSTHFSVLRSRSFKPYRKCPEAKWTIVCILVAVIVGAFYLVEKGIYNSFTESFRFVLFNTVSVATTAGFANTNYDQWPIFVPLLMIFLSMFCSAAGSTGGGIKMIRAVLLVKQSLREVSKTLHPRAINPVRISDAPVNHQIIYGVLAFMLMYGATIIFITMLLVFSGLDAISALTGTIGMINCMGPNLLGPANNFSVLTDFQTWLCSLTMILGRVELFPVLVLLTPEFWRK